jgi:phosphonate transport system substrate-binding protein
MTAGPSVDNAELDRFAQLLFSMSYADPVMRPLLDLEGLKEWRPPRLDGYELLERAVNESGFYDSVGGIGEPDYRP